MSDEPTPEDEAVEPDEDKKPRSKAPVGAGMAVGIAVGVALGAAFDNVAMGIVVGVALGSVFDWQNRQ